MLRRVLCGHGTVDVGRAVGVLLNRSRNRALQHTTELGGTSCQLASAPFLSQSSHLSGPPSLSS
eukprot:3599914-Prymnesium_polylepis.1